jgi:hypothetical protein
LVRLWPCDFDVFLQRRLFAAELPTASAHVEVSGSRCAFLSGHLSAAELLSKLHTRASGDDLLHLELGCWWFGGLHHDRQV